MDCSPVPTLVDDGQGDTLATEKEDPSAAVQLNRQRSGSSEHNPPTGPTEASALRLAFAFQYGSVLPCDFHYTLQCACDTVEMFWFLNESSMKDNLTHKQQWICHKTKRYCINEEEKENAALKTQIQGYIVHNMPWKTKSVIGNRLVLEQSQYVLPQLCDAEMKELEADCSGREGFREKGEEDDGENGRRELG
nr:hypothetical protein Iba_chr12aCG20890 [Ipomoea batatas]